MADIYLTNSLTRKKEKFVAICPPEVKMYSCGMTVYDYAHIGHGRKYVIDDLLRRMLQVNGYKVNHVQNVTDVGHLTSDADEGEDKLEKGAKKQGKTVWEVAEFFTKHFYDSMDKLNILRPTTIAKATDNIPEQIKLVEKLIQNGHAYDTAEAVYFDVSSFSNYGKLFGQNLQDKQVAAREEVQTGSHKKNPIDFALWFKRVGRFANHTMHWDSPWGDGFPGWHIECSAMSMKYLGDQIDIHTGGEDHLPVHHPNEIAQSEAATGTSPFVRYWLHTAFLKVDGTKMSKSLGNFYTIEDVEKKGIDPLALRYFYLTAHYRAPQNFTWEALSQAQEAYAKLCMLVASFKKSSRDTLSEDKMQKIEKFRQDFMLAINDDLNMPQALAVVWATAKSNIPNEDKYDLIISFDEVLGFKLSQASLPKLSPESEKLLADRQQLRVEGKFDEADKIRVKIEQKEKVKILDTAEGVVIKPR